MSLFDTDKESIDRGTPSPNAPDVIIDGASKSHKTISTHYDAGADANAGFLQMQNKQLIASDGTTPIGLYGYNAALASWGFFLTKAGTDVTTNTDLSKFIFNSNQDTFKIVTKKTANFSITTSGSPSSNSISINHGLGYQPQILGSVNITTNTVGVTGLFPIPFIQQGTTAANPVMFSIAQIVSFSTIDTNNIGVNFGTWSTGTLAGTVTVYIIQETAN